MSTAPREIQEPRHRTIHHFDGARYAAVQFNCPRNLNNQSDRDFSAPSLRPPNFCV